MLKALRNPTFWSWLIITVGAVLRGWQFFTTELWYDEAFSLLVARLPLADVLAATAADVHPPVYYLIIHGLLRVFAWLPDMLVLRGFSWLCGVASLTVFWQLSGVISWQRDGASRYLTYETRLAALALLALSPVAIFYAQEGRMYAWLQLLVVVQLLAILQRRWWLVALSGSLLLYTHNYGLFYQATLAQIGLLQVLKQPVAVYKAGHG